MIFDRPYGRKLTAVSERRGAEDLFLFRGAEKMQILRYAQDDTHKVCLVMQIPRCSNAKRPSSGNPARAG